MPTATDSVDIDYSEYSWIWNIQSEISRPGDYPSPEQIRLFSNLPLEIARLIFEKALEFTPQPLHFLRISHQIQHWLEPLVYEHITLDGKRPFKKFYRTFREHQHSNTKNAAFFQQYVHTLFICAGHLRIERVTAIVQNLTGLRSLACWDQSWGKPAMNVVLDSATTGGNGTDFPYRHLRRISFTASLLVDRGITFSHRAFRDLTHIDIYFHPVVNWETLHCLQGLTHLSLDMATELPTPTSDELPYWFSRILNACPPTLKVVIFSVVDENNADFDLLDSEGGYLPPGWPPCDSSPSTSDMEGWNPWLASESRFNDNIDLDILHPISRLALGQIDPRAVVGAVTAEVPHNQLFRDLLLFFVWPGNKLDWDGSADQHRDCWTVAEDIVKKRQGLTYAKLLNQLTSY